MNLHYVFDTEALANGAQEYICTVGSVPITGNNAKTGELEPTKAKTELWAIPFQRITDSKWVFPIIPPEVKAQYPQEVVDAFQTNFPNTEEEFDTSWLPPEEE